MSRPSSSPGIPVPVAFAWTAAITVALWFGLSLVIAAFGKAHVDIVTLGLTQVAVYVVVLTALGVSLHVSGPRELLALRSTSLQLVFLGLLLGAALQIPATLLSSAVDHFFPMPEAVLRERMARITPRSPAHAVAIFSVVAVLGPCVEEFFFRGGLFGALRHRHGALLTNAVTSLCFALGHLDTRLLLPLFVTAIAIAEVRERTRSIWPGLAVHAAFNATTLAAVFGGATPEGKPPPIPLLPAAVGCALTLALLLAFRRESPERS